MLAVVPVIGYGRRPAGAPSLPPFATAPASFSSDERMRIGLAYHEAGHVICMKLVGVRVAGVSIVGEPAMAVTLRSAARRNWDGRMHHSSVSYFVKK